MGRRRRFLIWLAVLAAVWAFANLPRDGGSLKRFLQWAGCPWTFAFWHHGRLEWFDPGALAADVVLGVAVVIPVAWLCAWSRGAAPRPHWQRQTPNQALQQTGAARSLSPAHSRSSGPGC